MLVWWKVVLCEFFILCGLLGVVWLVVVYFPQYRFLPPLCSLPFSLCQGALYLQTLSYNVRPVGWREGVRCEICMAPESQTDKEKEWMCGSKGCGHYFHKECYFQSSQMTPHIKDYECPVCTGTMRLEIDPPITQSDF